MLYISFVVQRYSFYSNYQKEKPYSHIGESLYLIFAQSSGTQRFLHALYICKITIFSLIHQIFSINILLFNKIFIYLQSKINK